MKTNDKMTFALPSPGGHVSTRARPERLGDHSVTIDYQRRKELVLNRLSLPKIQSDDEHGGATSGKADWAWLQHTLTSLKSTGRAAVVLDTGAVTRGSGSRNEDREKTIRKWFVDHDLVEGVILLPDNLFYNTTAAGIIILLNRHKLPQRKGKIVLVNASQQFKKGRPKNYIPDESIRRIAQGFIKGQDIQRFVKVITNEEAEENDYNLSPSRYVDTSEKEEYRPIPEVLDERWGHEGLEKKAEEIDADLRKIFNQLGFREGPG